MVPHTEREAVEEMLQLENDIDLIIPRGGEELIRFVTDRSRIPVIKHYKGVCHIFLDESADPEMSTRVCLNAKVQRPGVCNAVETLLVHEKAAERLLPESQRPFREKGGTPGLPEDPPHPSRDSGSGEADWYREYLDLVLSVRVVRTLRRRWIIFEFTAPSHRSDPHGGLSECPEVLREVNSSCVLVNASTRFNDGFELGLGAEIGISTSKLHAFGPMVWRS